MAQRTECAPGRPLLSCALLAVCALIAGTGALRAQPRHYLLDYLSPLPDSRYVQPGTNIILRATTSIDRGDAMRFVRGITGTKSGRHDYAAHISDDGRTLICRPVTQFLPEEQVTVDIDANVAGLGRSPLLLKPYAFSTGSPANNLTDISRKILASEFPAVAARPRVGRSYVPADRLGSVSLPDVHVVDSGATAPGYIFVSNLYWSEYDTQYLLILNNDGSPAFSREMDVNCYDFMVQPNGLLTYYYGQDGFGFFQAMDNTLTVVDSFKCGNGYATDPHELILLPNGHAMFLGTDPEYVNMSELIPGGVASAEVIGLIIQELDSDKNVVFQWRSWDHFNILDAWHINFQTAIIDPFHGNALDIDTDGNILLSSRHLNEITKINHETGDIIWRLGGANNQFAFVNDTLGFSFQHDVRRISNGHITLFDNGNFHVPSFSRAVEYALDEQNMTATLVWQYRDTPDAFGFAMGDVQRLGNGNTLIGWGAGNPTVTEVDSTGKKLYEMTFDDGIYSYRAFRFQWQPPVTAVREGGGPPEYRLYQNYPNPFNPSTTIQFSLPKESHVKLEVVNVLGQQVSRLVNEDRPAGTYTARFDGSGLASGVYFYRLEAGDFVQTRRLLLLR